MYEQRGCLHPARARTRSLTGRGILTLTLCLGLAAAGPAWSARHRSHGESTEKAAPPRPQPVAGETGFTLVGATVNAEVFIDGDKIGTTPLEGVLPLSSGEHTIRVVRPGYAPYIDVFVIKEGKVTKIPVELAPVSGVLRLRARPDKTRVFVDGKLVGEAPIETDLKVGPHAIRLSRFGYQDQSFNVSAIAGALIEREFLLAELPPGLNPYRPLGPPPPKWYEKWWVWTAGAAGVAVIAVSVIVPTVYYSRDVCQRLGADLCLTVPAGASQKTLLLHGRF